jgi:hypothetical protein
MAYLPASLDKLLGIYLLARLSLDWFVMIPAMGVILMIVGAITILGAVLMALCTGAIMLAALGASPIRGYGVMIAGAFGIFLGTIGMDPTTGIERFSYGIPKVDARSLDTSRKRKSSIASGPGSGMAPTRSACVPPFLIPFG